MEPFIGQIQPFGFNFPPSGWARCDGQLLAISSNSALFSLLGTIYGGDGETTFALPDLRGRVALHQGNGPGLPNYNIGSRSGNYQTVLTTANLPAHSHLATANVSSSNATDSTPIIGDTIAAPGTQDGRAFVNTFGFNQTTPNIGLNASTITVGNTGSNTGFNNMQPYLTINWCIALFGVFPSW